MTEGLQFSVPQKRHRRRDSSRSYTKKSGVFATPRDLNPSGRGITRESVLKAAQVFADQARKNASRFSKRIPAATFVDSAGDQRAEIVTDGTAAPNAAPFEFGERHPLNYPNQVATLNRYGRSRHWVKQRTRAYMSNAAKNPRAIQKAADVYASTETELLAQEHGYK